MKPTVGDWIPCSKKMPEEKEKPYFAKVADKTGDPVLNSMRRGSKEVAVTVEFEDGTRITKTSKTYCGKWQCEKDFIKKKVIAWMPLPEPYKGE